MVNPELIYGLVLFVAVFAFGNAYFKFSNQKNEELKSYWLWAMIISIVLAIGMFLGVIGYYITADVIFFLVIVIAVIRFFKTNRAQQMINKDFAKSAKKEPLKFTDIFTQKGWVKLVIRIGLFQTALLLFIVNFVMIIIILLILSRIMDAFLSTEEWLTSSLFLSLILTAFFIYNARKITFL